MAPVKTFLYVAPLGQAASQAASSHFMQLIGTKIPSCSHLTTWILALAGLTLFSCFREQYVSQARHPVHFSASIIKVFMIDCTSRRPKTFLKGFRAKIKMATSLFRFVSWCCPSCLCGRRRSRTPFAPSDQRKPVVFRRHVHDPDIFHDAFFIALVAMVYKALGSFQGGESFLFRFLWECPEWTRQSAFPSRQSSASCSAAPTDSTTSARKAAFTVKWGNAPKSLIIFCLCSSALGVASSTPEFSLARGPTK